MRVFAGHDGGSGCAYYRMELPLGELGRHDGFDVEFASAGDYAGADIPVITAPMLRGYDVVVGQRWNKHEGLAIWRGARTPYNRLVYDLDDDVWNVTPENTKAYELYARGDIRDASAHAAATADLVTVSTEPLAEVLRGVIADAGNPDPNVVVLPNHVPAWVLELPRERRDRPRIGWAGAASHGLDIGVVAGPVRRFLKRFPGWDLQVNGTDYRRTFADAGCDPARLFFAPWIQVNGDPQGFYRSIDFDIGLCPLVPTPFSRSKSAVKALEMNVRGIPVLASDCEPYRGYVRDGVNGWLVRREHEWLKYASELAADGRLREKMGEQARECAREYLIEDGWRLWADAYEKLFKRGGLPRDDGRGRPQVPGHQAGAARRAAGDNRGRTGAVPGAPQRAGRRVRRGRHRHGPGRLPDHPAGSQAVRQGASDLDGEDDGAHG